MSALRDWRESYGAPDRRAHAAAVAAAKARLRGDAVDELRQEIEDAEAARADALAPAFHHPPRLEEAARLDEHLERLHREHDALDARPRARHRGAADASTPLVHERLAFVLRTHADLAISEQAAQLGVSTALITQYRRRLADEGLMEIRRRDYVYRDWTPAEEYYLRDHAARQHAREIADALGRTETSVRIRGKRLGLQLRIRRRHARIVEDGLYNASDVAAILGIDMGSVSKQLIPWGILRARKVPYLGQSREMWSVKRQDLVDFLLDYPWQYDRERIRDPFFRRVADEAHRRRPLITTREAARLLGLADAGSFQTMLPRLGALLGAKIPLRRRGDPRAGGKSLSGMRIFVERSLIERVRAAGWRHPHAVAYNDAKPTARHAAQLLMGRDDRPASVTRSVLATRLYRLYRNGAIPTEIASVGRRRWTVARSMADVLAMKGALFAEHERLVALNARARGLIARHDPELLHRPNDLALQRATGELHHRLREWFVLERTAQRDLLWRRSRRFAFVTKHMARVLELLGPRTKIGNRRGRLYHRGPCTPGLVEVPLALARGHGLALCERCYFESRFRRKRADVIDHVVTCVYCRTTYRRGRGRPPKVPTCPGCRKGRAA